jgi:hypothetical protein
MATCILDYEKLDIFLVLSKMIKMRVVLLEQDGGGLDGRVQEVLLHAQIRPQGKPSKLFMKE